MEGTGRHTTLKPHARRPPAGARVAPIVAPPLRFALVSPAMETAHDGPRRPKRRVASSGLGTVACRADAVLTTVVTAGLPRAPPLRCLGPSEPLATLAAVSTASNQPYTSFGPPGPRAPTADGPRPLDWPSR